MATNNRHYLATKKKVRRSKHMSKPGAAIVVRDRNGRWLFEVYQAKGSYQVDGKDHQFS